MTTMWTGARRRMERTSCTCSRMAAWSFTSTTYANVKPGPFAIRTGDFNADGHLDIGVAARKRIASR